MHTQGSAALSSADLDHIEAWLALALAAEDDWNAAFEAKVDEGIGSRPVRLLGVERSTA